MKFNIQKIKGKMTEKEIIQLEMAEYIGITVQSLNRKLNNKEDFKHSEITKIFTLLEVEKEEIEKFFSY